MEYKYFTLDKNPKQFKRISIGEYSIELRIEWNTRSKAWYVLGYSGDEIVISNVKMTPNQLYSIDIDSEYDLPYMIGIIPKYTNYDWDTETTFLIVDNPLSNTVEGLTVDGGVIERSIATSSDTHSRKALKGTENKYLFDVVSITQETGIIIICNGADASFKTVNLPQGRWDFTINGMRTITADTQAFRSLMNDYGVQIVDVGNNEYLWANNSDYEIKIEGLYPYAAGYDFNVAESSNESAKIHSVDNNGWVNRFTVCLTPFVDTVWEVYKAKVSEDYNDLVFRARKSLTGVKPSEEEALLEKYRGGLDPYSATIVNELTGVSDWVLDSDNNQIKYTDPTVPLDPNDPAVQWIYYESLYNKIASSPSGVCSLIDGIVAGWTSTYSPSGGTFNLGRCIINRPSIGDTIASPIGRRVNPAYDPDAEQEEKTLPLSTVVAQVISNAANGDVDAEELLNSLNKYDSYAEVEILPLIVDRHKQGIDPYSSGVVNELTGVSDWILDSDNNRIVYTEPNNEPCPTPESCPTHEYFYQASGKLFTTAVAAAQVRIDELVADVPTRSYSFNSTDCPSRPTKSSSCSVVYNAEHSKPYTYTVPLSTILNPAYDPNAEQEEKSIPLDVVAQQVISNAESGNVDAQKVTLSAALSPSLVSSLSDSNMQQWQAVKDAVGQLTGVSSWTFDNVDKVVRYVVASTNTDAYQYLYSVGSQYGQHITVEDACKSYAADIIFVRADSLNSTQFACKYRYESNPDQASHWATAGRISNPNYDPNYVAPTASITYQQVSDKIIANSIAEDQGVSLLAEAYIQEALLKFTEVDSLISQFEANKQPK